MAAWLRMLLLALVLLVWQGGIIYGAYKAGTRERVVRIEYRLDCGGGGSPGLPPMSQ